MHPSAALDGIGKFCKNLSSAARPDAPKAKDGGIEQVGAERVVVEHACSVELSRRPPELLLVTVVERAGLTLRDKERPKIGWVSLENLVLGSESRSDRCPIHGR